MLSKSANTCPRRHVTRHEQQYLIDTKCDQKPLQNVNNFPSDTRKMWITATLKLFSRQASAPRYLISNLLRKKMLWSGNLTFSSTDALLVLGIARRGCTRGWPLIHHTTKKDLCTGAGIGSDHDLTTCMTQMMANLNKKARLVHMWPRDVEDKEHTRSCLSMILEDDLSHF